MRRAAAREVMHVDAVNWDSAKGTVEAMRHFNKKRIFLLTIPHKLGIGVFGVGAVVSVPMIFVSLPYSQRALGPASTAAGSSFLVSSQGSLNRHAD